MTWLSLSTLTSCAWWLSLVGHNMIDLTNRPLGLVFPAWCHPRSAKLGTLTSLALACNVAKAMVFDFNTF